MRRRKAPANRRPAWLPMLAAALLLLFGCSKPEPPRVTPRSAQIVAMGPTGLEIAVEVDVFNPNAFPLVVSAVDGTLELANGITAGRGRAEPRASIGAKTSSVVGSQLSIPWNNLAALAPLALSGQAVPYSFRGIASVGGKRLTLDVPFTLRGELTPQQLMQLGLPQLGSPTPR